MSAQPFADSDQSQAGFDFMSRVRPKAPSARSGPVRPVRLSVPGHFSQHVADQERSAGNGFRESSWRDGELRIFFPGRGARQTSWPTASDPKLAGGSRGQSRSDPETPGSPHRCRNPSQTIRQRAAPTALIQLSQDEIPLPTDALRKVASRRQIGFRSPIIFRARRARKKRRAHPIQRRPINCVPSSF